MVKRVISSVKLQLGFRISVSLHLSAALRFEREYCMTKELDTFVHTSRKDWDLACFRHLLQIQHVLYKWNASSTK